MLKTAKGILRLVSCILSVILGVALLYWLYTIVKWWILLAIPVTAVAVGFPLMMRHGMKILNKERDAVYSQLAHNLPVKYNTSRIFRGFAELLGLMWFLPPIPFIVAGQLWVAILPAFTVVILVVESIVANIWVDIGWSKAKYWLMNIGIYIFGIIVGVVISNLI